MTTGIADFTPFPTAVMLTMHHGQLTFTLADLAILSLNPLISRGLILLLEAVSLALFGTYLHHAYKSLKNLAHIVKNCFVHGPLSKRLQPLLAETHPKSLMKWLQIGIVGVLAISFLLGRFWIF